MSPINGAAAARWRATKERLAAREKRANPEAIESLTAEVGPQRHAGRAWKITALVGGPVIVAAVTAMVTLALTHRSAVMHNAGAYANGLIDGYDAYENAYIHGLIDGRYEAVQAAMTLARAA